MPAEQLAAFQSHGIKKSRLLPTQLKAAYDNKN